MKLPENYAIPCYGSKDLAEIVRAKLIELGGECDMWTGDADNEDGYYEYVRSFHSTVIFSNFGDNRHGYTEISATDLFTKYTKEEKMKKEFPMEVSFTVNNEKELRWLWHTMNTPVLSVEEYIQAPKCSYSSAMEQEWWEHVEVICERMGIEPQKPIAPDPCTRKGMLALLEQGIPAYEVSARKYDKLAESGELPEGAELGYGTCALCETSGKDCSDCSYTKAYNTKCRGHTEPYSLVTNSHVEDNLDSFKYYCMKLAEKLRRIPKVLEGNKKKTYKVGQEFRHDDGDIYVLANVGNGCVAMMRKENINVWSKHVHLEGFPYITEEEFNEIVNRSTEFTLIKGE